MEASDADISRAVAQNLLKLIENLNPPRPYGGELSPDGSRDRFRTVVKVCFNLMKHPGLEGKDLTGRQKWLAEEWQAPRPAGTNDSRSPVSLPSQTTIAPSSTSAPPVLAEYGRHRCR